jgi:oxygen-dependent protoporphyrinogen oxidase
VNKSDEEILQKVREDLDHIMDIEGEPTFYKVKRWQESMPQYQVGHVDMMTYVFSKFKAHYPKIILTGASYNGIGLPDCITQGKSAAEDIIAGL